MPRTPAGVPEGWWVPARSRQATPEEFQDWGGLDGAWQVLLPQPQNLLRNTAEERNKTICEGEFNSSSSSPAGRDRNVQITKMV